MHLRQVPVHSTHGTQCVGFFSWCYFLPRKEVISESLVIASYCLLEFCSHADECETKRITYHWPGKATYGGSSSAQRHDAHSRFSVVPRISVDGNAIHRFLQAENLRLSLDFSLAPSPSHTPRIWSISNCCLPNISCVCQLVSCSTATDPNHHHFSPRLL